MVIAFANNQSLTAVEGNPSTITTDPVPLGNNDRATAMLNVHSLWESNGGGSSLSYQAQVSNDGVNWVNVTALTDTATGVTSTPRQKTEEVNGAYIRFRFTHTITTAGETGGVCFDLHVKLDHV